MIPSHFRKLTGGFLAFAALTVAGSPVGIPVPVESCGKVPGWNVRTDNPKEVSGIKNGFRLHSPAKTIMLSASEKIPLAACRT